MNQGQRLDAIINQLNIKDELTVEEAVVVLGASPATVRRDFRLLSEQKKVEKTWGGVRKLNQSGTEILSLNYRSSIATAEKKQIAKKAVSLINKDDIIFIDGGTTTFEMAPFLVSKRIRVITNSLLIAQKIHASRKSLEGPEVILLGGLMYARDALVVGPQTIENLKGYHADWVFLSVGGLEGGWAYNSNQLVVEAERAMMANADKSVLMADYTKIGKRSLCKMCRLDEVDYLITNNTDYANHNPDSLQIDPGRLIIV